MIRSDTYGTPGNDHPLVIAHGLFGSARNWRAIAKRLARERHVVVPDMRNHGDSGWHEDHDYPSMAGDIAGLIDRRADVLGHSMGGKAAMALALTEPDKIARLIVADIAPVAYDHERLLDLSAVETRSDAEAQLAEHVADPGIRAFLLQSLEPRERRWKLNLDVLSDRMGEVIGWPDLPGTYEGPTLVIAGERSEYVGPRGREAIERHFPAAEVVTLKDAGHWLHAEQPEPFLETVMAFLSR